MIDYLKTIDRYKNFTFLEDPVPFNEFFQGENYSLVQLHDIHNCGSVDQPEIVGFAGAFQWVGDILTPLDGDTYYDDMLITGYNKFDYKGDTGLDILVEEW